MIHKSRLLINIKLLANINHQQQISILFVAIVFIRLLINLTSAHSIHIFSIMTTAVHCGSALFAQTCTRISIKSIIVRLPGDPTSQDIMFIKIEILQK